MNSDAMSSDARDYGMSQKRHVFIIGSKGIPASYGGFETFVQELVRRRKDERICYHVACSVCEKEDAAKGEIFRVFGADCFYIPMRPIGPAKAVLYDLEALAWTLRYIRENQIRGAVVYILACRIGPFLGRYAARLRQEGATVLLNPDGHEWKRAKWNRLIRAYWKYSEGKMVMSADQIICDSKAIARYIRKSYPRAHGNIRYLSYGSDVSDTSLPEETQKKAADWLSKNGLVSGTYYLIVGRFVPENNYETVLREFIASDTEKKLAIISNVEENKFYRKLQDSTGFVQDHRVVLAGTLYDGQVLAGVRQQAFAYIHGHEVGGTNPSLLEAMGSTNVNLLYDVAFNREVGEDAALYWSKEPGSLREQMRLCEQMSSRQREALGNKAKERIRRAYSWERIVKNYEKLFLSCGF